MTTSARWWTALTAAALFAGSVGCVTKGKYNDLVTERDQLQANRDALAASNSELSEKLAVTEIEVAELRDTYNALVSELQTEMAAGQIEIRQLIDGIQLNVSDELLFPSGSADLNAIGDEFLGRVADQIKGEGAIISVEGHTDNVGISSSLKQRYPTNWELAGARAASVVRVLSEAGMDPKSLRAVSRGPFAPVASNDTAEGRAKNRRTEIIVRPAPR
jgi:chemotaxis protein MotB